jgi:hypothetical protein
MGLLRWEKELPRAAAGVEEFRAQSRPQPSSQPSFPTSLGWCEAGAFIRVRGGSFDRQQARQLRAKRRRVAEFEPGNVFGTKLATI